MIRAVIQLDLDVDQWITGDNTLVHSLATTLFNSRNKFAWNNTTFNCIFERKATPLHLRRSKLQVTMTILTTTTRLLDVLTFSLSLGTNSLTISNLRFTDSTLHLELTLHAINDDVEMQLTHARNNGLQSLGVSSYSESRIFLSQLQESTIHLLLIDLSLRFHSQRNNRLRESHLL